MRAMLMVLVVVTGCAANVAPAAQELDAWSHMPAKDWKVDPSERAIDIWTAEHGEPTAECAELTRGATIHTADFRVVASTCQDGLATVGSVAGCLYAHDVDSADIMVDEDQDSHDLRTHELLHVLLECAQRGDGDRGHTDAVWTHVPVAW